MKLESDIDKVYAALVILESIGLFLKVNRTFPLEKQISNLEEFMHNRGRGLHPSRRLAYEVSQSALRTELARVKAVYAAAIQSIEKIKDDVRRARRLECPEA